MEEKLNQFNKNDVWTFVPMPENKSTIGTRWIFRNKLDEQGKVVCNKARLVAWGYNQQKVIDFSETFVHVARLEVIRIILAFVAHKNIKLFQKDVKSAFLNGFIEEEAYVKKPLCFEDQTFSDHVFKLKKALYSLKAAPCAWYDRLSFFLLENNFVKGKVDTTLFRRKVGKNFIIVQIYYDDIIFGATNEFVCKDFSNLMKSEFEISMMGELKFFLGLQIE